MVRWNFARGLAWLALFPVIFGYSLNLAAQDVATCKGPAELEQTIKVHPSAGAYDALGAYFGQREKISCAISAFESAVHLDPNSWEAHFNLALALLQSNQPTRAVRELRIATRLQPGPNEQIFPVLRRHTTEAEDAGSAIQASARSASAFEPGQLKKGENKALGPE